MQCPTGVWVELDTLNPRMFCTTMNTAISFIVDSNRNICFTTAYFAPIFGVELVVLFCYFSYRLQTALHKAAWYGYQSICEILVNKGASLTRKDYQVRMNIHRAMLTKCVH